MIVDHLVQMVEDRDTGKLTYLHQVVFYKIMKFQNATAYPSGISLIKLVR